MNLKRINDVSSERLSAASKRAKELGRKSQSNRFARAAGKALERELKSYSLDDDKDIEEMMQHGASNEDILNADKNNDGVVTTEDLDKEVKDDVWYVKYHTEDEDLTTVWFYAKNAQDAVDQALDEYWNIYEIVSVYDENGKTGEWKAPKKDKKAKKEQEGKDKELNISDVCDEIYGKLKSIGITSEYDIVDDRHAIINLWSDELSFDMYPYLEKDGTVSIAFACNRYDDDNNLDKTDIQYSMLVDRNLNFIESLPIADNDLTQEEIEALNEIVITFGGTDIFTADAENYMVIEILDDSDYFLECLYTDDIEDPNGSFQSYWKKKYDVETPEELKDLLLKNSKNIVKEKYMPLFKKESGATSVKVEGNTIYLYDCDRNKVKNSLFWVRALFYGGYSIEKSSDGETIVESTSVCLLNANPELNKDDRFNLFHYRTTSNMPLGNWNY